MIICDNALSNMSNIAQLFWRLFLMFNDTHPWNLHSLFLRCKFILQILRTVYYVLYIYIFRACFPVNILYIFVLLPGNSRNTKNSNETRSRTRGKHFPTPSSPLGELFRIIPFTVRLLSRSKSKHISRHDDTLER